MTKLWYACRKGRAANYLVIVAAVNEAGGEIYNALRVEGGWPEVSGISSTPWPHLRGRLLFTKAALDELGIKVAENFNRFISAANVLDHIVHTVIDGWDDAAASNMLLFYSRVEVNE